tara:strand:- start:196 stop:807 length:612 start_codon:yes stop_codon:yes gene_type:complete
MNDNKVISSEKIILETPPDISVLNKYDKDKLIGECNRLNIPREQYEASNDEDKNRKFMISEILRLEPPIPKIQKPTLINSEYDETTMTKTNTMKYVKHIINSGKYSHSIITTESYKLPLTQREIDIQNKNNLLNSIKDEISGLNLDDYKNKNDILMFACDNGKSNGEKYRRASLLSQSVIEHMRENDKYIRPRRITHFDISVY